MKFKRVKVPAHRDYYLTLVRTNGERMEWYLPYVYHSHEAAQKEADSRNPHYKHGQLIVEYKDYPESWGLNGYIRL